MAPTPVPAPAMGSAADASTSARLLLWQCPICLDALREPLLTSCCGQSFCRACLDEALRRVDACPMCRAPLLSGTHSMTRNRALEQLLERMALTTGEDDREVLLLAIGEDATEAPTPPTATVTTRLTAWIQQRRHQLQCVDVSRLSTSVSVSTVRLQQWRHWLRIHWATLQCVFYVMLFGVFVFFLRVQEEEFAAHEPTTSPRLRLRTGGA